MSNFFGGAGHDKNAKNVQVDMENIPQHIGVIMDGNGRWAKSRMLPRNQGHRAGSEALKRITNFCSEIGVKYLTVYAFSTENWKRPKDEVDSLMKLLLEYLKQAGKELQGKNNRIRVIGDRSSKLSPEILQEIRNVEEMTAANTGLTLTIALNYGSRDEIVHATKSIAKEVKAGKMSIDDIDEALFSKYLYTSYMPDPDMIIRPSGEMRLSNFLMWQAAYSEFWYSDINWPDFSKDDLLQAIADFQARNRRFGGI